MNTSSLSPKAGEVILRDAVRRDVTTARRAALLDLLWNERFLTRAQLIGRVERRLGKYCFGKAAWEDNFYRDMRVVKLAFGAAGFRLAFSRNRRRSGYYLLGQADLSPDRRGYSRSRVLQFFGVAAPASTRAAPGRKGRELGVGRDPARVR